MGVSEEPWHQNASSGEKMNNNFQRNKVSELKYDLDIFKVVEILQATYDRDQIEVIGHLISF